MTFAVPFDFQAPLQLRIARREFGTNSIAAKESLLPSAKKAAPAERGTKTAKILALLKRPGGASLQQLRKVTGWQAHSVRGFLSGTLKKKMGLRGTSTKLQDGERTYRIISK
jgi:hypothetical protein